MPNPKADLLLHPLRMRIIMTIAGKQMTAQQLTNALPDVAQATLYRHLNKLAKGGVLKVVEEHPVRGTMEKVYALDEKAAHLNAGDVAHFTKDDHMHYFTAFVGILLGQFAQYLDSTDHPDVIADGVAYVQTPLYLSDTEFRDMAAKINAELMPLLQNQPAPGRRRRLFSSIVMPAPNEPEGQS